jgi:hypothetical protein
MRTLLFIAFLLPTCVFAHAVGESYETPSGPYTVDIGYSTKQPASGEAVSFSFLLRQGTEDAPFSDVWVTVTSDTNAVVLATGVHNTTFGGPRLSYIFPAAGHYTVAVRYEDGTTSLAEANIPITVMPAQAQKTPIGSWMAGVLGFVVGCGVMAVLVRRRRS